MALMCEHNIIDSVIFIFSYDELVVGAPMYTEIPPGRSNLVVKPEIGRVYVFYNTGVGYIDLMFIQTVQNLLWSTIDSFCIIMKAVSNSLVSNVCYSSSAMRPMTMCRTESFWK